MTNVTYDEIFGAVLTLPPLYRAMLAEHLLKSLDEINSEVENDQKYYQSKLIIKHQ
ncbi:hypothetical protein VB713_05345 [Anabaena cylindrica UHCC 0172]|uniref:hypothetical protein n=1 Tax=Anabaena cylindrica TaxID=1165 RepID=UPI002B1EABA4|nr:hypothetical protein [Anabaena cylindrica]MEA5550410.1 hypothetical protein [Anabaena cylindrica UHCC 0172]